MIPKKCKRHYLLHYLPFFSNILWSLNWASSYFLSLLLWTVCETRLCLSNFAWVIKHLTPRRELKGLREVCFMRRLYLSLSLSTWIPVYTFVRNKSTKGQEDNAFTNNTKKRMTFCGEISCINVVVNGYRTINHKEHTMFIKLAQPELIILRQSPKNSTVDILTCFHR